MIISNPIHIRDEYYNTMDIIYVDLESKIT